MITRFLVLLFLTSLSVASPKKLPLCATCHGQDGIAPQTIWPNLNGQSKRYLMQQLYAFKNDTRVSPLMAPYAKMLETEDIIELSTYYATLTSKPKSRQAPINEFGKQIYHQGLGQKRVPACSACHGPNGLGNDSAKFPKLAGQNQVYLMSQLQAFKHGQRQSDMNHIMRDIASRLSQKEMIAVSKYLEYL
jgi:cytochrome c553